MAPIEGTPAALPEGGRSTHVVLLSCPGTGHVLPAAELARRVVALGGGFTVTLVTHTNFSSDDKYASTFASLPPSVSTALLPEVSIADLPADARVETLVMTVVKRAMPHLRDLLRSLLASPAGVAAVVPDQLCPWALEVARDLGIPGYVFCSTNLMALSTLLHAPELDRTTTGPFRDLPDPIRLPGCVPLRGAELLDTVQDRGNEAYGLCVELGELYLLAQGFVVNTFGGVEGETQAAWKELSDAGARAPAYAVGPIVRRPDASTEHGSLRWLDGQPDGSVLYVCFGSGGTLSTEQTAELAAGLEASGQRFLWVVQFVNDKDKYGSYLGGGGDKDDSPVNYLPEGFVERTQGRGLAVPLWAPQVEILSHPAVGGFVSHCGWNSTLEAVAAGVPTIAWPLYAEQKMNAKMLSERAGMALRVEAREEDGVVGRDEVAAVARELMAGEKGAAARSKARQLREEVGKSLAPDGPSRKALKDVAGRWKKAAA